MRLLGILGFLVAGFSAMAIGKLSMRIFGLSEETAIYMRKQALTASSLARERSTPGEEPWEQP